MSTSGPSAAFRVLGMLRLRSSTYRRYSVIINNYVVDCYHENSQELYLGYFSFAMKYPFVRRVRPMWNLLIISNYLISSVQKEVREIEKKCIWTCGAIYVKTGTKKCMKEQLNKLIDTSVVAGLFQLLAIVSDRRLIHPIRYGYGYLHSLSQCVVF